MIIISLLLDKPSADPIYTAFAEIEASFHWKDIE
jgi:hypothetical protein